MTPAVAELVRERTEAVVAHTSEQCRPARTQSHVAVGTTARDFLAAVDLNTRALRVTAVISGERIENVEEEQTATIRRPSRPITLIMSINSWGGSSGYTNLVSLEGLPCTSVPACLLNKGGRRRPRPNRRFCVRKSRPRTVDLQPLTLLLSYQQIQLQDLRQQIF